MAKTATAIINKAKSFIGVKESPANSNNVVFNTDYYGKEVHGSSYPWCCAYVWDIFWMCNASDLFYDGKKTAYCQTVYEWAKSKKLLVAKGNGKKGDLVIFDWQGDGHADHIGFILSQNADGSYNTVEGNTAVGNDSNGGQVMKRKRAQSTILAIVRPKYKTESTTKTATTSVNTKNPYSKPSTNVRYGQTGNSVKWVQLELRESGHKLTIDGDFGKDTLAAVKKFQKSKKLTVDGIVGKKTREALVKDH